MKMTNANTFAFYLHFIEWYTPSTLGTEAILPATGGAAFHIGSYPTTAVYLNPMNANGDTADTLFKAGNFVWGYSTKT